MQILINEAVGRNVKKYMDQRGLKQFELAKLAGVSTPPVSDLIRGKKMPTVKFLEKLAKVLGCSMKDLFREE